MLGRKASRSTRVSVSTWSAAALALETQRQLSKGSEEGERFVLSDEVDELLCVGLSIS